MGNRQDKTAGGPRREYLGGHAEWEYFMRLHTHITISYVYKNFLEKNYKKNKQLNFCQTALLFILILLVHLPILIVYQLI